MSEPVTLKTFQLYAQKGPVDCSRILGIKYVTYNKYKNHGLPRPVQMHIQALMMLPRETFKQLAEERIHHAWGRGIIRPTRDEAREFLRSGYADEQED